ncbi:hypothetical protein EVAR_4343_1 [Eumeta japonica]|uniref:Uncharacterized protein n=1 Tax=Eumeta variegata TaxID=151549 RepID=A0A4C1VAN7_EUMVA|nr:hypothetical protein EVAR_4343_1 [Eumeta japonica]
MAKALRMRSTNPKVVLLSKYRRCIKEGPTFKQPKARRACVKILMRASEPREILYHVEICRISAYPFEKQALNSQTMLVLVRIKTQAQLQISVRLVGWHGTPFAFATAVMGPRCRKVRRFLSKDDRRTAVHLDEATTPVRHAQESISLRSSMSR